MSEAREGALATLQPANDHTEERLAAPGVATTTAELMALVGESLLDALFGHGAPSYVAGVSGELLYANAAYKRLANEAATELLPSHRRAVQRVRERGEAFMLHETLGSDETARTYTSRHFPIMAPDGGIAAIAATFNDATGETEARARARRERQRLQDVIRSTSDWVWETDETGAISFVSDRVTEALGIPPLLVKGRPLIGIGRFVSPEAENAPAVLLGRRPFRDAPFEIEDRLGQTRRFHLSGVPVFDDTGRFLGYRGTASDVSERHAAEERARRSRRELEFVLEELTAKNLQLDVALRRAMAATEAKREFLATMSHELRTPLNAIIGFSEMMHLATLGPLPTAYHGYVGDMLTAGRHLLSLIDDILDVARIEGDALRIDIVPIRLAGLIADARAMIETRAGDKRIDVTHVAYDGQVTVMADHTRLLQVVINLLGNAVKFTPKGGQVGVRIDLVEPGRGRVTVWDTGPGIPPSKQELIFEKFQQVHETILSRREAGIGLGLTLSRQLARLMGGELVLDHSDSSGSCFSVMLPLAGLS